MDNGLIFIRPPDLGRQIAAFLRNFGDLLENLKVSFIEIEIRYGCKEQNMNEFVFEMIVKYCTGPLTRLELINCHRNTYLGGIVWECEGANSE